MKDFPTDILSSGFDLCTRSLMANYLPLSLSAKFTYTVPSARPVKGETCAVNTFPAALSGRVLLTPGTLHVGKLRA